MSSMVPKKPHVVLIPMPAQGHVHPFMQLAQLLHSKGFYITFVNTEFNHGRLLRSKGLKTLKGLADFKFETISDGLPPSDRDATQDPAALCDSLRKLNCLKPLLELLAKLNSSSSSSSTSLGVPPVSYIISDGAMSFAIKAAESLGIPEIQFWTASACGLMGYLQFRELASRGLTPLKDETYLSNGYLDTKLDWVPGMPNIRLKDLPSFVRTSDRNDVLFNYLKEESQNCLKANAIIFNTFDDLEQEVLHAISSMFPHIYTIGPLSMLCNQLVQETDEVKSLKLSLWKEDLESLEWLEKREPNSVLYVNFGCVTVMSEEYLREFAWGLVNSKHPFLWIIRPDIVMGEDKAVLPEEIVEEIKDRGKIVSWCPQDQVLLHPSIGGFLTHCGWNSILESLIGGVPMICWPFFAEQQTNCRYACETWEVGMELDGDVKREEVEKVVKELMEGEEGKKMRKNALKWKEKAEEATMVGGSSYKNFDRILKEVLHPLD